jgi:hypothetical protein
VENLNSRKNLSRHTLGGGGRHKKRKKGPRVDTKGANRVAPTQNTFMAEINLGAIASLASCLSVRPRINFPRCLVPGYAIEAVQRIDISIVKNIALACFV